MAMDSCILCENELEAGRLCRFCGLDNKLTGLRKTQKHYEFVWPGFVIRYPATRGKPLKVFVKGHRMRILTDLEKKSIRVTQTL